MKLEAWKMEGNRYACLVHNGIRFGGANTAGCRHPPERVRPVNFGHIRFEPEPSTKG